MNPSPPEVVVDWARQADRSHLQALAAESAVELDVDAELARDHAWLWVARRQGSTEAVDGFLLAWQVADEVELLDVVTLPAARRQGVGRALLQRLFRETRTCGARAIHLEVRKSNQAALALYRRAGFEEVGCRTRYYADGEDALLLRVTP